MAEEADSNLGGEDQGDAKYREEIKGALSQDTQRIGDVWQQMSEHGPRAEAIKDALGLATVGSVYIWLGHIDTVLKCNRLTSAPTLALQRARMLRSFSKRHEQQLSDKTKDRLRDLASEHQRVAEDEEALADEAERIETRRESARGTPGIYVYTLPHYMRFPVMDVDNDESNPRTYLKVGMSSVDTKERIQQQVTTALPEPPLLLRIYAFREANSADYGEVEDKMHRHFNAADHNPKPPAWRGQGVVSDASHFHRFDSGPSLVW